MEQNNGSYLAKTILSYHRRLPFEERKGLNPNWNNIIEKKEPNIEVELQSDEYLVPKKIKNKFFFTGSSYTGEYNFSGMTGNGTYEFPHGVTYDGEFKDGAFHGDGVLTYPKGQTITGKWDNGLLTTYKYNHDPELIYVKSAKYCKFPDRRYYKTIKEGFKPATLESVTADDERRELKDNCFETGTGVYESNLWTTFEGKNYKTISKYIGMQWLYPEKDSLQKQIFHSWMFRCSTIPTKNERTFIQSHYRKGGDEPVGYRPELYEHFTSGRAAEREKLFGVSFRKRSSVYPDWRYI